MRETNIKTLVIDTTLKYGFFLAGISILLFTIQIFAGYNPLVTNWIHWASLFVDGLIVLLAQKSFKDSGNSYMSYGLGLGMGFFIIIIASIFAGLFAWIYVHYVDTRMMDDVWEKALQQTADRGQNEEQTQMGIDIAKKYFWLIYFIIAAFSSLIVALIIPIFTQKKKVDPFA